MQKDAPDSRPLCPFLLSVTVEIISEKLNLWIVHRKKYTKENLPFKLLSYGPRTLGF